MSSGAFMLVAFFGWCFFWVFLGWHTLGTLLCFMNKKGGIK